MLNIKTTRRQHALDYDRTDYVCDLRHFVCLVSMITVCLWSSAWILLGLSCSDYLTIKLIDVQLGDLISVFNLHCQFIPVHATKAYGGSGVRAPLVRSLGVGSHCDV